ncbi:transglycosylase domain-containing protein [Yinghuangia seranimata]|uniref:transglycosylase domain-containing protein n=1 Tax=Yinghuangia seranimata TaxID=408067 RepID=UPI00248AD9DB|nr:transglycosylase domain-containing protein [Yinghuangia seranimata]MDI2127889.1 transglycosylase domain-containing protein [Yinghuangia seranimata]
MARTPSGKSRPGSPGRRPGRPPSFIGFSGRIAAFIGAAVLAGALLAGIALPIVGGLGLAAKAGAENFDDFPNELEAPYLAQPSYIYDANGNQLAMLYDRYRILVGIDQVAPIMKQAIVAIEDSRFYQHGPIDLKGTLRALVKNQSGGDVQGGSSLTQQYVKNIFVELAGDDPAKVADATKQELSRKIKELKYAIGMEQRFTKEQILEKYLNIIPFGQRAFGIEAASYRYFGKHAKDLSLPEAALLAGVVNAPTKYDPIAAPNAAKERRNIVLARMAELKIISPADADAAKATELNLKPQPLPNGCIVSDKVNGSAFFCDYAERVVKNDPVFGKTKEERDALWRAGGLRIKTTLDPKMQEAAYKAATEGVLQTEEVADAVVMIEPGTGQIKAMAQSRPYGFDNAANQTVINYSVGKPMGGSELGFQPGSTFKPITAAAALEAGFQAGQQYTTETYIMKFDDQNFSTCDGSKVKGNGWDGKQGLKNESKTEFGTYDMQTALANSINTYFVMLEKDMGICPVATLAQNMGVTLGNGKPLEQAPSMTLGSQTVTPLSMANAYATFAARGKYCAPIAITEVTRLDGTKLPVPGANCRQLIKPENADIINALLAGVTERGTGQKVGLKDGRDNAGKTGTTDKKTNAWFVGYTPQLSTAVWVGHPQKPITMEPDDGPIMIGGKRVSPVYGSTVPGPIWNKAMTTALAGQPKAYFTPPPGGAIPPPVDQHPKPADPPKPDDQNRPGGPGNPGNPGGPGGPGGPGNPNGQ